MAWQRVIPRFLRARDHRGRPSLWWGVVGLGALGVIWAMLPYTRSHQTCLRCRLDRTHHNYLLFAFSSYSENECSLWYEKTQERHEHEWVRSSCSSFRYFLILGGYACGPLRPVFRLPPEWQRRCLEKTPPAEREAFFESLRTDYAKTPDDWARELGEPIE